MDRMPWQGNEDNLIDRFDVRAHLDWIPEVSDTIDVDIALTSEDRHINYERYRIIVQNEFLGGALPFVILYRNRNSRFSYLLIQTCFIQLLKKNFFIKYIWKSNLVLRN